MEQAGILMMIEWGERYMSVLALTGRNATEAFEDVGHSPDAREMQKKYMIGEVATPAKETVDKKTKPDTTSSTSSR